MEPVEKQQPQVSEPAVGKVKGFETNKRLDFDWNYMENETMLESLWESKGICQDFF